MNLYLLLALAFGAVTAPASVVRREPIAVVRRAARALTRRFAAPSPAARERVGLKAVRRVRAFFRIEAVLTGASTPRAPATIG